MTDETEMKITIRATKGAAFINRIVSMLEEGDSIQYEGGTIYADIPLEIPMGVTFNGFDWVNVHGGKVDV